MNVEQKILFHTGTKIIFQENDSKILIIDVCTLIFKFTIQWAHWTLLLLHFNFNVCVDTGILLHQSNSSWHYLPWGFSSSRG